MFNIPLHSNLIHPITSLEKQWLQKGVLWMIQSISQISVRSGGRSIQSTVMKDFQMHDFIKSTRASNQLFKHHLRMKTMLSSIKHYSRILLYSAGLPRDGLTIEISSLGRNHASSVRPPLSRRLRAGIRRTILSFTSPQPEIFVSI